MVDTTFLDVTNCDLSLAGVDTMFFLNEDNCDSLVITTTSFVESDTLFFDMFSCDPNDVGTDTTFLSNQFFCDSIIINTTTLSAADTTFIFETTCDVNQSEPTIEVFTTDQCDSLVITEFIFVEPDTTFVDAFACQETNPDTVLFQNFQGCDSLVITRFENASPTPTFLIQDTCDPSLVSPRMDTLSGEFCDSIVVTNFNLLLADTSRELRIVCSIEEVAFDTLFLTNTNGCDSLIIVELVFEEILPTISTNFTCDQDGVRSDSLILTSSMGCDSLIITNVILSEADTLFAETSFTCNFDQVGFDTLIFPTNTCDSVVIMATEFEPLDTTLIEMEECDLLMSVSDTINLISAFGCDSVLVINTTALSSSITNINIPVSLPSEVRIDTLILSNSVSCDSLVITNFFLETEVLDTVFVDVPTCDINAEPDTTLGVVGEVIIEIPIPIIIDTTFLENQVCSELVIENDTIILNSNFGCDSVVVTSFLELNPSITNLSLNTCDENQALSDTIFLLNQFACDSLVITNYNIITIEPTMISETTCDPNQELMETIILTSEDGCDSVVVVNYELVEIDTVRNTIISCLDTSSDTIMIDGSDCPIVEITVFENRSSDTTFLNVENCIGPFGVETLQLSNVSGCDSIIIQTTTEALQNETILEQSTCFENQANDTLVLTGQFCDSIVITHFIFEPTEPTFLESFTCDIDDVLPDTILLSSSMQCDSLLIIEKTFVEIPPTELSSVTCDADAAGIFRDTLVSFLGCDSIIIETIDFVDQQEIFLQEFTCDILEIGLDTTIVNVGGCSTFMIVETLLFEQSETTFVEENTCDQSLIDEIQTEVFADRNGCDSTVVTSYIIENFNLNFDISIEPPICNNEDNGIVNLDLQDAVEVLWLFDQQEGSMRDDLPAGVYDVQLSQNACDTIIQITVPSTPAILLNLEVDYILCSSSGGVIFSAASGGQEPYAYLWQDSSTDSVRINLANGNYFLTVTDALGCINVDSVQITNVLGLEFETFQEDVTCFGEDDGFIEVVIMSGTPPYTIEWQDGNEDFIRSGLEPGTYSCTVNDFNDCNIVLNRIVREPLLLGIELQVNNSGEFEALVFGGTPPFSYLWNDGNTSPVIKEPILGFGYEVTVTDASGCIAAKDEVFAQVSTSRIDESNVALFPNPNQGAFQFSFDSSLDLNQILIYNIYGKLISSCLLYTSPSPRDRG